MIPIANIPTTSQRPEIVRGAGDVVVVGLDMEDCIVSGRAIKDRSINSSFGYARQSADFRRLATIESDKTLVF